MKVKAPFEVWSIGPSTRGEAAGYRLALVPLRFCKRRFIGRIKSVLGHFYDTDHGSTLGWMNYHVGTYTWRPMWPVASTALKLQAQNRYLRTIAESERSR